MHDRDSVYSIATRETYFDFHELRAIQNATSAIPLYSLPDTLLTYAMVLGATVRQFQQSIEMAVERHRVMDAKDFEDLFRTLKELTESLELTCRDIENAVIQIERDV